MSRRQKDIEKICRQLLNGEIGESALEVDGLDEFQQFYSVMVNLAQKAPYVSFVNLETLVVAQFSDISPQHFDIISKRKMLTEADFDFVAYKKWYGGKRKPYNLGKFLLNEFLLNRGKLTAIFIVSFFFLFAINDTVFYEQLVSLLIQSATVFLSIYIIFTVSQSQSLYKDATLFKSGILQRYYRDDRNITLLGITTIAFTFLGSGIISLTSKIDNSTQISWIITSTRVMRAFILAVVIMMLFDTFFTVSNYFDNVTLNKCSMEIVDK